MTTRPARATTTDTASVLPDGSGHAHEAVAAQVIEQGTQLRSTIRELGALLADSTVLSLTQRLAMTDYVYRAWHAWRSATNAAITMLLREVYTAARKDSWSFRAIGRVTGDSPGTVRRRITSTAATVAPAAAPRPSGILDEAIQGALACIGLCADDLTAAVTAITHQLAQHSHEDRLLTVAEVRRWWREWVTVLNQAVACLSREACLAARAEGWTFRAIGAVSGRSAPAWQRYSGSEPSTFPAEDSPPTAGMVEEWVRELVVTTAEPLPAGHAPDDSSAPQP